MDDGELLADFARYPFFSLDYTIRIRIMQGVAGEGRCRERQHQAERRLAQAKMPPVIASSPMPVKIVSTGPNESPRKVAWKSSSTELTRYPAMAMEMSEASFPTGLMTVVTRPTNSRAVARSARALAVTIIAVAELQEKGRDQGQSKSGQVRHQRDKETGDKEPHPEHSGQAYPLP